MEAELKGCLREERKPWEKSLGYKAVQHLHKITCVGYGPGTEFQQSCPDSRAPEPAARWDPSHGAVVGIRGCVSKRTVAQMPKHWIWFCELDVVGAG